MNEAAQLCQELDHNANVSGQRPLERRLADLSIWHYQNLKRIPKENVGARLDFLERSFWIQLEVIALLVERTHNIEGSKKLWLPAGIRDGGSGRTFT